MQRYQLRAGPKLLVDHCLSFCEEYGADDAFPDTIPAEFAEAYHDLALEQMEEHGNAIEREVRAMLKGEWAAEILGVQDVLYDLVE